MPKTKQQPWWWTVNSKVVDLITEHGGPMVLERLEAGTLSVTRAHHIARGNRRAARNPHQHPAPYPAEVLDCFARHIPEFSTVLDPFAGEGGIHKLNDRGAFCTVGVELEDVWAAKHPDNICGDSTKLDDLWPQISEKLTRPWLDVIATSPTYANRLADKYLPELDANDRLTYVCRLGRQPTEGSSCTMTFGSEYCDLHRTVWTKAVAMLVEGGLFLLNCKDHYTDTDIRVAVTGWHVRTLNELGLEVADIEVMSTTGDTSRANTKRGPEFVIVLHKKGPPF